jgi:hypothetical protein
MTKKWIQKAKPHKGKLRKWSKKHKFIKNGKINLTKAMKYAKAHDLTKRIKEINMAKTLSELRKRINR